MTQDELNQYESTLWELEHDGYIDASALIRQQQTEINKLQETAKFLLEQLQEKDLELDEANQRYWNNK